MGGTYILYAESAQVRAEWKAKLDEALGLRKAVQENNKVFEVGTLSDETFLVPTLIGNGSGDKGGANGAVPAWNHENSFTGKVTCTVPLSKCRVDVFFEDIDLFLRRYSRWTWAGRNWMCRGCLDRV